MLRVGTSDGSWRRHDLCTEMKRNAFECRRDFFGLPRNVLRTAPDTGRCQIL
ncbi:hypothetical protein [Streptomyces sp. NPDC056549]|uniref:hypothetical protein n=1 Tax=Streptomyces sp. NPDC056549 TaxID=3345864 RepID=UPI0036961D91